MIVGRSVSKLPSGLEDPEDFWKSIITPNKKEKQDIFYYDIDDDGEDDEDDETINLDENDISFQSSHLFRKDDDDYIPSFESYNNISNSNQQSTSSNTYESNIINDFDRYELKTPPPKRSKGRRKAKQPQRFIYEVVKTPPTEETNGLRRSKRKRTAPLAFWKNEKPHYAISPTTGTRVRIGSFTRESPK